MTQFHSQPSILMSLQLEVMMNTGSMLRCLQMATILTSYVRHKMSSLQVSGRRVEWKMWYAQAAQKNIVVSCNFPGFFRVGWQGKKFLTRKNFTSHSWLTLSIVQKYLLFDNIPQLYLIENGDKMVTLKTINYNRQKSDEIMIFIVALLLYLHRRSNTKSPELTYYHFC